MGNGWKSSITSWKRGPSAQVGTSEYQLKKRKEKNQCF